MSVTSAEFKIILETVREAVILAICQQLGLQNLGELMTKLQTTQDTVNNINKDLPNLVDAKVNVAVNSQTFIQRISVAVSREQRSFRDEQAQDRREQFRTILAEQVGLDPSELDALVGRADDARLAQGKSSAEWPAAITDWLNIQFGTMEVTLGTLVNRNKTKGVDLAGHAKYLIACGLNPDDPAAVRRALESDSNFVGLLKKA